ncbi:MAG: hypothetical protein E7478_03010 [Ruminococcaceae bacterium]|nr:hypothetical protein [Oscillospiraceae bacterium]
MSKGFTAKAIAAVFMSVLLAACADSTSESGAGSAEVDASSALTAEQTQTNEAETTVTVFEAPLRNRDEKYDSRVYIYDVMSETEDAYRGDCAIEISDNGTPLYRMMLTVGYTLGQNGTEFSKNGDDGYFSVIELDSGSLLLSTRETDRVTQATLYTVKDGRIVQLERYFADPADRPDKGAGMRSFNLSRKYTTDGDSIIFDINGEAVAVTIDFDALTLKCDEAHESIVYCE